MTIVDKLQEKADALRDFKDKKEIYISEILNSLRAELLDAQRRQLFQGQASSGENIRPLYSEDLKPGGYFKSAESAARYASWKAAYVPYPNNEGFLCDIDVPNLFITGKFHSELDVSVSPTIILFDGASSYANEIIAKYGLETFGLSWEHWHEFFEEYEITKKLRENYLNL